MRRRAVQECHRPRKDEFLAVLSHELRAPLAPIVSAAQILRLRGNEGLVELVKPADLDELLRILAGVASTMAATPL